jgi:hypothetical protein
MVGTFRGWIASVLDDHFDAQRIAGAVRTRLESAVFEAAWASGENAPVDSLVGS